MVLVGHRSSWSGVAGGPSLSQPTTQQTSMRAATPVPRRVGPPVEPESFFSGMTSTVRSGHVPELERLVG